MALRKLGKILQDEMVSYAEVIPNYYTTVTLQTSGKDSGRPTKYFSFNYVFLDGGSTLNLIPRSVARQLHIVFRRGDIWKKIRVAGGMSVISKEFVLFWVIISGVKTLVMAWILPDDNTWAILLGRPFLWSVYAREYHRPACFKIRSDDSNYVAVHRDLDYNVSPLNLSESHDRAAKKQQA